MGSLEASLSVDGFQNIPAFMFKRGAMRKAFRDSGNVVAKNARRKLSGRAGSGLPARRTGRLMRSVVVKLGSKGLYAKVQHKMPAPASKWRGDPRGQAFYPAFLHSGTTRGIKPGGNWIADALTEERSVVQRKLTEGLLEAIS